MGLKVELLLLLLLCLSSSPTVALKLNNYFSKTSANIFFYFYEYLAIIYCYDIILFIIVHMYLPWALTWQCMPLT